MLGRQLIAACKVVIWPYPDLNFIGTPAKILSEVIALKYTTNRIDSLHRSFLRLYLVKAL